MRGTRKTDCALERGAPLPASVPVTQGQVTNAVVKDTPVTPPALVGDTANRASQRAVADSPAVSVTTSAMTSPAIKADPPTSSPATPWAFFAVLISVGSAVIAGLAYHLNRKAFAQNRARGTYHALLTAPAMKQVPECGEKIDDVLKNAYPGLLLASRPEAQRQDLTDRITEVTRAIRTAKAELLRSLSRACTAWGDDQHRRDILAGVMAWESSIAELLNTFGQKEVVKIDDLLTRNAECQGRLLNIIVCKDRSDLTLTR